MPINIYKKRPNFIWTFFLLQVSMDLLGAQSIINGDCSCIFPYMANTVLRNATGHDRGERDISSINRLIRWRFQPLRHFVTPPLYS